MEYKLYVGNLNYKTREESLSALFSKAGTVTSVRVIMDGTGRSRGFGFVEMSSEEECNRAIESINGAELDGRTLVVSRARPKQGGEGGGGGRGGRSGGGNRGGYRQDDSY